MISEGYYLVYLRKETHPTFGEVFMEKELCITDARGRKYAVGLSYFLKRDYTLEPLFPATPKKLSELEIILQDSVNVLERFRTRGTSISWKEDQEMLKVWENAVHLIEGLIERMKSDL